MSAIENFLGRVKSASRTRTSDVRIPVNEATELCAELAQVLNESRLLREELETLKAPRASQNITFDGGSL
jgi:hypothetical protein